MGLDAKTLWAEVKENRRKRAACPAHRFPSIETHAFGARFTCLCCGAWMSLSDALSYVEGFKAAGGDPEIVLPGITARKAAAS